MKTIVVYMTFWIGLVFLAILNGTLREKGYAQFMSELSAHQLSTFIFIVLSGVYMYAVVGWYRLHSSREALLVGALWVCMTVAFEFLFGHYVMGHSWSKLFHDYNLLQGRVWALVLVWTLFAPYIFYRMRS